MSQIKVDFSKITGKAKPMHAVNNGPVYKFSEDQRITNIDTYRDAGIPYARIHDASFFSTYGGEHCVDVANIFTNFDADENDPANYDFTLTDEYLHTIDFAGTKTFYRLGSKIEHWQKKYNILPPKDFAKWARICEHIVKHYTEGWADGFHYDMKYWEIWNEPDYEACWGGTKEQYFELYDIAAKHLKATCPGIKVGGPALCWDIDWAREFIAQLKAPLDFFSWHCYTRETEVVKKNIRTFREILDNAGFTETESILDEWNYVRSFIGDDWIYSLRAEKSLKGAAYTAAVMCIGQSEPLDMLMYYDARPCSMNGLYSTDLVCDVLKGYYPFKMFNTLYKLGTCCETSFSGNAYACAAVSGDKAAIMATHFAEDDDTPAERIKIDVSGFCGENGVRAKYFLLDEEHDLEEVREEIFTGDSFAPVLDFGLNASYLIELEKI